MTAGWLWRRPTGASMMPSSAAASRHACCSLVQGGNASSNTFASLKRLIAQKSLFNGKVVLWPAGGPMPYNQRLMTWLLCLLSQVTQHVGHPQPAFQVAYKALR